MVEGLTAWFRSYQRVWLLGPVVWVLLAAAGAVHAHLAGLPLLEVILTWQEWFAALLLLPYLATIGTTLQRDRQDRPSLLAQAYLLALIVFALDILVRASLGLGWEPFLLG